ncbi:MAG: hypothetical protein KC620_01925, partial [Myxococcales bacterium]|nr:hypothetical protein [Myxococcales bacterium]
LARSICGPGDAATGLSGQLIGPRGAALDGVPIFALFTPVEALRQVAQQLEDARPRPTALRVPVLPAGLLGGRAGFDVGELVPGIYRVQFFADEDGDHAPTPCGPELGGGDRYVAEPIEVEVVAGVHAPLAAPIELRAGDCPDPLTGLRGTLALAPTLAEQWAADPSLVGPLGVLDGSVRLALVSPQGGVAVVNRTLLTGLSARPLPQPFTVTGVPPGIWRAQVFVDRDADGRFTRCSGWPAGLDAVFVQREEVRIRPGEVLDLGALVLERADCDDEPATGLRGALRLPAEAGAAGSGRAVRMELYPTDNRGERRGLLLFENHREATAGDPDAVAVFNRPVAPGAYRGVIFLDTDGDGAFTGCPLSPYGDRSAVETGPIEVVEGRLTDLGELTVAPLGCPVPPATLTPILSFDQVEWPRDVPLDLAMQVREAGGWSLEWSIGAVEPLAELTLDSLQLAPGRYEVTAFVDEDGDGQLDPCDADVPDRFVARTPLQLDEQMPAAQARLALQPACAR